MYGSDKEILTTTDAARILGVSVRTAQLLIESGSVPSWKTPGGHRRVYRRDVLALVPGADGETESAPERVAPAFASARVVLIARPERIADYERALVKAGCGALDSYSDTHAALLAIGYRLPAVVVIEAEQPDSGRQAILDSLRSNPALGHTRVLVVGRAAARNGTGGHDTGSTRFIDGLPTLPEALEATLRGTGGPIVPFEGTPPFPVPGNEGQRLLAVERLGLVDTPPEDCFDRLTWLATRTLDVPVALLTLLTPTRQWFKSRQGLDMIETPRSWAFCNHTILQEGVFVAEDLTADERFADNPAVIGGPGFRFYAGCPVIDADGFAVASLCVIDVRPRSFDETQKQILANLAALTADEIKLRAADRQLRWALEALDHKGR
ncbi:GAF domain-containing protein [Arenibaculum pallidiluteum]|uniref:GAF domain-containing protein n=1 Tax=Arenibaculum pallidiluteum TaxID=2812559 RepID=UPI001A96A84F|nr:GAF domain-containing protein [Arenibaculum pallidiluteum]